MTKKKATKKQAKKTDPKKILVVEGALRVRAYPVLVEAVEAGVSFGWRRAHKHVDEPTEEEVRDAIADAVVSEVCERFDIDPENFSW